MIIKIQIRKDKDNGIGKDMFKDKDTNQENYQNNNRDKD